MNFFHESVAKRHQFTQNPSFLSAVGCAQNIFSTSICMIFVRYERDDSEKEDSAHDNGIAAAASNRPMITVSNAVLRLIVIWSRAAQARSITRLESMRL